MIYRSVLNLWRKFKFPNVRTCISGKYSMLSHTKLQSFKYTCNETSIKWGSNGTILINWVTWKIDKLCTTFIRWRWKVVNGAIWPSSASYVLHHLGFALQYCVFSRQCVFIMLLSLLNMLKMSNEPSPFQDNAYFYLFHMKFFLKLCIFCSNA